MTTTAGGAVSRVKCVRTKEGERNTEWHTDSYRTSIVFSYLRQMELSPDNVLNPRTTGKGGINLSGEEFAHPNRTTVHANIAFERFINAKTSWI